MIVFSFYAKCSGCGEVFHGLTEDEAWRWWDEHPKDHFGGWRSVGDEEVNVNEPPKPADEFGWDKGGMAVDSGEGYRMPVTPEMQAELQKLVDYILSQVGGSS